MENKSEEKSGEKYVCDETNPLANGSFGYVIACSSTEPNKKIVLKLPLLNFNIYKKRSIFKITKAELLLKIRQLLAHINSSLDIDYSAQRLLEREISILKQLGPTDSQPLTCENIVKMLDIPIDKLVLSESLKKEILLKDFVDNGTGEYKWVEKGYSYLPLEYCNGGNLTDFIGKNKYNIKDVLKQIFNGLKFMKSRRIIHLDLKPENILVNTDGVRTIFKITDFGIAKGNDSLSITHFQFGTLLYLPDDKDLIYTTYYRDLYAFYCIIYYLYNKKEFNNLLSKFNRIIIIPGYLADLSNVFLEIQKKVKREVFESFNYGYKSTNTVTNIKYDQVYNLIDEQINLLPETENKIQFIKL